MAGLIQADPGPEVREQPEQVQEGPEPELMVRPQVRYLNQAALPLLVSALNL